MIAHYLNSAIKDIESLIELTKQDIENIKQAHHEDVFKNSKIKEELITSFENKKSLLDNELRKLIRQNGSEDGLEKLLKDDEKQKLDELKNRLAKLHKMNKNYAKLVASVSEFYTSLISRIFPHEMDGYTKAAPKPASLLKVRA